MFFDLFQLHTNDLEDYWEDLSLSVMENHTSACHHISVTTKQYLVKVPPAHRYISAGEGPATRESKVMSISPSDWARDRAILSPVHLLQHNSWYWVTCLDDPINQLNFRDTIATVNTLELAHGLTESLKEPHKNNHIPWGNKYCS